jgi:hypothetical protein
LKEIETSLINATNKIVNESRPIVDFIFEDLINQIDKKKIVEKQKIDRIDSIKLKKLKDLNSIIRKNLKSLYGDSQVLAKSELEKRNFAGPIIDDTFLKVLDEENFNYIGDLIILVIGNITLLKALEPKLSAL